MPVGATLAVAGAGLASGAMSANAQKKAGQQVSASTDRAADLQNQQFQQLLALQMPGYNRANAAGDLYSQALGISRPSYTAPTAQGYQTQPSMTGGGYGGGFVTPFGGGNYDTPNGSRFDAEQDMAVSPQARLMTGGGSYTNGSANVPAPYQVAENTQPALTSTGGAGLDIPAMVRAQPGYQAQLDQGLKSIDRAAPLVGGMYSGRRMKALEAHGQNTFGSYYDGWLNRVGGVAGQEQQISQNIGQAGMQNAQNVGGLMMTGANARAQGAISSANAWGGAISDVVGAGMMLGGQAGWFKK